MKKLLIFCMLAALALLAAGCTAAPAAPAPEPGGRVTAKPEKTPEPSAPEPPDGRVPVDGGTVSSTDGGAQKVIESKDVSELSARFYVYEGEGYGAGLYDLTITKEADGYLLEETQFFEKSASGKKLGEAAQEIIDAYSLAERSGFDEYTNGLPAEYQPSSLYVLYASGETLWFRCDGEPEAEWAGALARLVTEALAG